MVGHNPHNMFVNEGNTFSSSVFDNGYIVRLAENENTGKHLLFAALQHRVSHSLPLRKVSPLHLLLNQYVMIRRQCPVADLLLTVTDLRMKTHIQQSRNAFVEYAINTKAASTICWLCLRKQREQRCARGIPCIFHLH